MVNLWALLTFTLCHLELVRGAENLETVLLEPLDNIVISPFSIYSTFDAVKLGSEGDVRKELDEFLVKYKRLKNKDEDISSSTFVFSAKNTSLLPSYKKDLEINGIKLVEGLNFSNIDVINNIVKTSTGGMIENLIGPNTLSAETKFVILNTVFFDGAWKNPFLKQLRKSTFTHLDGSTVQVPMMYKKSTNYIGKNDELSATIVEIPYKLNSRFLRIYLPYNHDGLPALIKKLSSSPPIAHKLKYAELELHLPPFKIESTVQLSKNLQKLGLKSASGSNGIRQSKISGDDKNLKVDEVICKSVLELTQTGTKGGSATGAFIIPLSGFVADEIKVNRPFYFEVRDSTNVYFSGTFIKPSPETLPQNIVEDRAFFPPEPIENKWWVHSGLPNYLETAIKFPRFQEPEPRHESSIRFPYPLSDPNSQLVIYTHLKNSSAFNTIY